MSDHEHTELAHVPREVEVAPLSGLASARAGLLAMDDQRQRLVAARDVDALANGSADLAVIASEMATLQKQVRLDIAEIMVEDHRAAGGSERRKPKREVPGLGIVEVNGGSEWKDWDSPALFRHVALSTVCDNNGEVAEEYVSDPLGAVFAALDALAECLPLTTSLGWKVGTWDAATKGWKGGLRGRGIDPEDWGERVDKPRMAKVPARKMTGSE